MAAGLREPLVRQKRVFAALRAVLQPSQVVRKEFIDGAGKNQQLLGRELRVTVPIQGAIGGQVPSRFAHVFPCEVEPA